MSSAVSTAPGAGARERVTPVRAAKAEWIKLVTLRSSWITLAVAVLAIVGLGLLLSWLTNANWSQMPPDRQARFDAVGLSLGGVSLAQLAIGVLGVLVVTGEYASGMIRSSLMAVPHRLPVLAGKLVVFGVVTFVLSLISAFAGFELGQQALGSHGTTLGSPHAVRAVIGVALYLTVVAAFAIGLGFAIRNTAGGIAALFALLLVLPGIARLLPSSWQPHVVPYLPSDAGTQVYAVHSEPGSLGTWEGFGVFCAWAVAALVLGAYLLRRRDA